MFKKLYSQYWLVQTLINLGGLIVLSLLLSRMGFDNLASVVFVAALAVSIIRPIEKGLVLIGVLSDEKRKRITVKSETAYLEQYPKYADSSYITCFSCRSRTAYQYMPEACKEISKPFVCEKCGLTLFQSEQKFNL